MSSQPSTPSPTSQPTAPLTGTHSAERLTRLHWSILLLILGVGTFLRFHHISKENMWLDEVWAIEMSMGRDSVHDHLPLGVIQHQPIEMTSLAGAAPWWQIWTHLSGITHPPLYNLTLRWWMDGVGTGTVATRSLSAIFSILGLLVFFDICRRLHGPAIALWAVALMALATGQVNFAQETRGYTILIFLALCCANLIVRIEKFGATLRRLVILTGMLLLTALTHYLSMGALLAMAIYAGIRLRGPDRRRTLLAFPIAAALFVAAWGPQIQVQRRSLPLATLDYEPDPSFTKIVLKPLSSLPAKFILGWERYDSFTVLTVTAIFLMAVVIPLMRLPWRRNGLLWVLWICGSLGMVMTMDMLRHTHASLHVRYTVLASLGIYAAAAGFDWPRPGLWRHLAALSLITAAAIVAFQRTQTGPPNQGELRSLADTLDAKVPPGQLVVFYSSDPWVSPGAWYLGWRYYSPKISAAHPWLALMGPADENARRQLASSDSLWMVGLNPGQDGPRILPGWTVVEGKQISLGAVAHLVRDKTALWK